METVFIQINSAGQDWDSCHVIVQAFDNRMVAVDFAKRLAQVTKHNVRMTYPGKDWEPSDEMTIQQYAGRLSGSYFNPTN